MCSPTLWLTLRQLLLPGVSPKRLQPPPPSLPALLHDAVGLHLLAAHCAARRACDELLAWLELEMYRLNAAQLLQRHQAKRIVAAYLSESDPRAAERLGVPEPIARAAREEVARRLAEGVPPSASAFSAVQRAIEARLEGAVLPGFLRSEHYARFVRLGGLGADIGALLVPSQLDFLRTLGAGGYGVAVLARRRSNLRLVAVKAVDKRALLDRAKVHTCFREKAALAHLCHPFLLSLKWSAHTREHALFVCDYEMSGSMYDDLRAHGVYGLERTRLYAAQLVLAIAHLHEGGMLHRDIKPDNVLLASDDGRARLADMGAVRSVYEGGALGNERLGAAHRLQTFDGRGIRDPQRERGAKAAAAAAAAPPAAASPSSAGAPSSSAPPSAPLAAVERTRAHRLTAASGTHGYLAPEVYSHQYDEGADWWNLGLLVVEMLTGTNPLRGEDRAQSERLAKTGPIPEGLPGGDARAAAFVSALLQRDRSKRLGCTAGGYRAVMAHPFFEGIDWDELMDMDNQPGKYPNYARPAKDAAFKALRREPPRPGTNSIEHFVEQVAHLRSAKARRLARPITAPEHAQFDGFAFESLEALREDLLLARGAANNRPTAFGTPAFVKYRFMGQ